MCAEGGMRKRDWACVQEELAASVGVVVSSWQGRRYDDRSDDRSEVASCSLKHQRLHQGRVLEGWRNEGRNEERCEGFLNDWERLLNDSYDSLEEVSEKEEVVRERERR